MNPYRPLKSLLIVALLALMLILPGCNREVEITVPPDPPGVDEQLPEPEPDPTPVDEAELEPPELSATRYLVSHPPPTPRAADWKVTEITATNGGEGVVITAEVSSQQSPLAGLSQVEQAWAFYRDQDGDYQRREITDYTQVADHNDGDYTLTIAGLSDRPWWGEEISWLVQLRNPAIQWPQALIVAHDTADGQPVKDLVTDQGCINCHGQRVFIDARGTYRSVAVTPEGDSLAMTQDHHFAAIGVEACVICHGDGDELTAFVHGIHNSSQVNRNTGGGLEVSAERFYSVRYPGDLKVCSACHQSQASLQYLRAQPVEHDFCASCHGATHAAGSTGQYTMDWPSYNPAASSLHGPGDENCIECHNGVDFFAFTGDVHPGNTPELQRAEQLALALEISKVEAAGPGSQIKIHWRAFNHDNDENYNLCHTGADLPVFFDHFTVRLSSLQADDPVNHIGGSTTAPGQPAPGLLPGPDNTVCNGDGSAVTTLQQTAPASYRAMLSFDGRPRLNDQPLRLPMPTYVFRVENGAEEPRRQPVETEKCLACHRGALYRHDNAGGGRSDNAELCITCHNPAATDQHHRREHYEITANQAYDRKGAESISFAWMMHAIHGAGANNAFYAIYRPGTITAYGGPTTAPPGWQLDEEGRARSSYLGQHGEAEEVRHTLKKVNYPRPLTECQACHSQPEVALPDPGAALAMSIDSGVSMGNHNDDTLIGPATAACMSCHRGDTATASKVLLNHAYLNSWPPQIFARGKRSLLEGKELEACLACHGRPAY
ncbi:multiheme c-type cytochrome [Desulfurivibrio alkaliphilus]|nr:cytochrome c3 family protein [Desulfurivibrio alkaliphilus]